MSPIKKSRKFEARSDLLKLACVGFVVAAVVAITPALSTPAMLSVVATLLLSPVVAAFERRGHSRGAAIAAIFGGTALVCGVIGFWAAHSLMAEWDSFRESAPQYFQATLARVGQAEASWKARYSFLESIKLTASLVAWGEATGKWFLNNGAALAGDLFTCLFVVPFLTSVLLKDGRSIRKRVFELVPNRFFEASFIITTKLTTALSDYIRAKLVEAFLVGLLTGIGLWMIGAPYVIVLSVISGVTNILPYIGPIIGVLPALLMILSDPAQSALLWPLVAVYTAVNLFDMVVIFPLLVAKLVNLHPMILIVAVMVGQQYYGLVGMLISIPIATGLKVVLHEIHSAIYDTGASRRIGASL
jgi:putative permease